MRSLALSLLLALLLAISALPQQAKKVTATPDLSHMQQIQQICNAWATLNPENAVPNYEKAPVKGFYDITGLKYIMRRVLSLLRKFPQQGHSFSEVCCVEPFCKPGISFAQHLSRLLSLTLCLPQSREARRSA